MRHLETELYSPIPFNIRQYSPQASQTSSQLPSTPPRVSPCQPAYHRFRPIAPVSSGPDCRVFPSAQFRPVLTAQQTAGVTLRPDGMPCLYCKLRGHKLIACPRYNNQPIQGQWDFIQARNRCQRCLGPHYENECKSTKVCRECGSVSHHTSLHSSNAPTPAPDLLSL